VSERGKMTKRVSGNLAKPDYPTSLTVGDEVIKAGDLVNIADQDGTFEFVHLEPGKDGKADVVKVKQVNTDKASPTRFFHASRVQLRPKKFRR